MTRDEAFRKMLEHGWWPTVPASGHEVHFMSGPGRNESAPLIPPADLRGLVRDMARELNALHQENALLRGGHVPQPPATKHKGLYRKPVRRRLNGFIRRIRGIEKRIGEILDEKGIKA
jgi:hypothetical protein